MTTAPASLHLRQFEKSDWDAFAGAERFQFGDEPLISDVGEDAVLILSGSGVEVCWTDPKTYHSKAWGPIHQPELRTAREALLWAADQFSDLNCEQVLEHVQTLWERIA